jgi:hypothetical protein
MKKLRYLVFTLSLVLSAGAAHASSANNTSLSGSTDGEFSRGSSVSGVESFDSIAEQVNQIKLSLDVLKKRTDKSSSARTNIEMDDDYISGLNSLRNYPTRSVLPESPYGAIEALYNSIIAMEYVGKDKEAVIKPLLVNLDKILASLPDVSALSDGEDDPKPEQIREVGPINNTMNAVNAFLGTRLTTTSPFSEWAQAVRDFFASEENENRRFEFTNILLTLRSGKVKKNSSQVSTWKEADINESYNFNRLFCYHLARAAGYAHEKLIQDILSELKDCIQGTYAIVRAFNRTLVFDIRPLLLQVRLLEDAQVLKEYFDSLLSLAKHTRFGVRDSVDREIYRGYGESDPIYKELQRVYNSLQLHVMRLRIEEKIRPALEAELENNPELLRLAEERQAEERRLQEEARFASMAVEARNAARTVKLESLITTKMDELKVIEQTHTAPDGLLDKANREMIQVRDDFNTKLGTSELTNREVIDLFTTAGDGITAAFNKARQAIEAPARERFADIATAASRTDKARQAKLEQAKADALSQESLRGRGNASAADEADALRAKRIAEIELSKGGVSEDYDEASARRFAAQATDPRQAAFVREIVEKLAVINTLQTSIKMKAQRYAPMNRLGDELKVAVSKLSAQGWIDLAMAMRSQDVALLRDAKAGDRISSASLNLICDTLEIK